MKSKTYVSLLMALFIVWNPAQAEMSRDVLPVEFPSFKGEIKEFVEDSTPDMPDLIRAPDNAPNVFVMMSDDVGFSMSSSFGGPVQTPNIDRIASQGIRYNRFHSTAICSPSRAALLTGRNHHNTGTGHITDMATGYPGYHGYLSRETATIAEILRLNGYNTAMLGKHHNVPGEETTANGPFDRWPTGLGFEYFYGYLGPESDQFQTNIYRGTNLVPNDNSMELLDKRLADDAIHWLHNQQALSAGKPFFMYFSPSSTHEPHQAPEEFIEKFRGRFDDGWDEIRRETWKRQIEMGIIPPETKLPPRPDAIPAWDSLTTSQQRFAARSMEVAAGMLAYQDQQVGRVLSEMERMGLLENTLVVLTSDNGGSADQGVEGAFNRVAGTNRIPEDDAWRLAHIDELGGPNSYANYQAGWSWAMNTPFRWHKQYASMLGGIRNGTIISWTERQKTAGEICSEFGHLVDIAPTILEATGIPAPSSVDGVVQKPIDGKSLLGSLTNCEPDRPRTQYFEIGGKKGLWHNGWFASHDDGRKAWERISIPGERVTKSWTLYNLNKDFSQSIDLSDEYPEKLEKLVSLWRDEAEENHVYPIDHSGLGRNMPKPETKNHYKFWGKNISIPATQAPIFTGRSFTLRADLKLDDVEASGVITALGSKFGGWSFFLDEGTPVFVYARTQEAEEITMIKAAQRLPLASVEVELRFNVDGVGGPAEIEIWANDQILAEGRVPATLLVPGGSGEMLDTGRDSGVPVLNYNTPFGEIEGDISLIELDFSES